jgi:hypothetical protein
MVFPYYGSGAKGTDGTNRFLPSKTTTPSIASTVPKTPLLSLLQKENGGVTFMVQITVDPVKSISSKSKEDKTTKVERKEVKVEKKKSIPCKKTSGVKSAKPVVKNRVIVIRRRV